MIIRSRSTKPYRGRGRSGPPLHSLHRTNSTIAAPPSTGLSAANPCSSGQSGAAPPSSGRSAPAPPSTGRLAAGGSAAAPPSVGQSAPAPPSTARLAPAPPSTGRSAAGGSVAAPPSTAQSVPAPPSTARSAPAPAPSSTSQSAPAPHSSGAPTSGGLSATAPSATDDPALETSLGDGSFAEIDRREVISVEATSKPRRFVPPSVTRYIISNVMTRMPVPAERWKDYPYILKGLLFKDFMDTYRFASESDHAMAKIVWERTCMDRYPDYLKKARDKALKQVDSTNLADTKGHGPKGMIMEVWDGLVDIWLTPKWKNKSESSKRNRARMRDSMLHTGGSIGLGEHKKRMEAELKHPVKFRDVYSRVHKKKDGEYVSQRSKHFLEAYDAKMQEIYGEDASSHPEVDREVWAEMSGSNKKGRVLGGRSLDIGSHGPSSSCGMGSSHNVQQDIKEAVGEAMSTFVETQLPIVLQAQLMSILQPILSNLHGGCGSQATRGAAPQTPLHGGGAAEEYPNENWLY